MGKEKLKNDTNPPPQVNLSRDNHYIPQMYQLGWSDDGKHIWEYRTLVHDARFPAWQRRSISNTGVWKNCYVRVSDGKEKDDFEHMFNERFETPAMEPLMRARKGQRLTKNDWQAIIRFICAQHVRTPAFYLQSKEAQSKNLLEAAQEALDKTSCAEIPIESDTYDALEGSSTEKFSEFVPIKLTLFDDGAEHVGVKIETMNGKGLWLKTIQHLLDDRSILLQTLCSFRWSIVDAPEGVFWPTCDNPLVRGVVLPSGETECVFGISEANIILFPISAKKLLITRPGMKLPFRSTASVKEARILRELIIKNAFLNIYCISKDDEISVMRPKMIDNQEATRISNEFEGWYDMYKREEAPLLGREPVIIDERTKRDK